MMNCFKKTIIFTLLVMLMCTVTACAKPDNAAEFIYLTGSFEDVTITNAIGEYYRYEEDKDSIYDDFCDVGANTGSIQWFSVMVLF